jgi:hypothetical protein
MIHIEKPTLSVVDVFADCISNFRDTALTTRLQSISTYIHNETNNYDRLALNNNIYQILTTTTVNGIVTKEDMVKVYEKKLVPKGEVGRSHYEYLRSLAKYNICPLCNQRTVTTLDHVLAKTDYPTFAVSPINLIPACSDCNKIKLASYTPTSSEEEILHPYYDDISDEQYLVATVNEENPSSITFKIKSSIPETVMEKRLKVHFKLFALNELYIANSAKYLADINFKLGELYDSSGKDSIKEYLQEEFESRYNNNKNSWETAFYEALYKSDWFCDGGFKIE